MQNVFIPQGYQQVMPYLVVKNASAFFTFMQTVFGATQKLVVMRDEETIMHAEMQIGASTIMYTDANDQYPVQNAGLFICVDDCDAIYQKALNSGATSIMQPADLDYGRGSGVTDPFGNTLWITRAV